MDGALLPPMATVEAHGGLYQFHDILPGSAIAWVYREVVADHRRISDELTEFIHHAQELLAGRGDEENKP
jgi:alpha-mannosidase